MSALDTKWSVDLAGGLDGVGYVKAVVELREFADVSARLRGAGERDRQRSFPFRELGVAAIRETPGDPAYRHGALYRRVERVLPPTARALAPFFIEDAAAPVCIGPSRRIRDPHRIDRLEQVVRAALSREGLQRADRDFLARCLRTLDPLDTHLLARPAQGLALGIGAEVSYSATSAAAGSWVAHPIAPRFPPAGAVASIMTDGCLVVQAPAIRIPPVITTDPTGGLYACAGEQENPAPSGSGSEADASPSS